MPSIAIPVSLRGQLLNSVRAVTAFSPSTLFALNEPGVWYDPSDVANLAWRRNLLTFTEQFGNAIWLTSNMSKGSAQTDPLGGSTAIRISATGSNADFYQTVTVPAGTYVNSIWVRRVTGTGMVNLNTPSNTPVALSLTSSWQRFSASSTLASGGGLYIAIRIVTSGDAVDVAFAQSEAGSVATDYQKITNVNTEVIERFPSATLYQDAVGTIPVTTPGDPVGLALDKSKGLVLGPAATLTAWSASNTGTGTATISGDSITIVGTDGSNRGRASRSLSVVAGSTYRVDFTLTITSGAYTILVDNTAYSGGWFQGSPTQSGSFLFRAVSAGTAFIAVTTNASGGNVTLNVTSVKELPGFHAVQTGVSTLRPTYGIVPLGGRRNLLTRTEEFSNADWTLDNSGAVNPTVTANFAAAPNGTLTADRIQLNKTGGLYTRIQQTRTLPFGVYTFSVWLRNNISGTANVGLRVGSTGVNCAVTETWQRFSVTLSPASTVADAQIILFDTIPGNDETADILAWGAQLETGSTATNYQRVGAPSAVSGLSFDVTEAGVQSLSYLWFDGVDDFMVTPTITPGIDKAQVFAGVRKLNSGVILELSVNSGSGASGTVLLGGNYSWRSNGTALSDTNATIAAPSTNVVTGLGDIAGDTSIIRVNGTQANQNTANQGTGNYLAYPLYIGRRGGTLNPFDGQIFSLIVRFGTNLDAGTITSTETWVGGNTGFVAPTIVGVPTIGVA